MTVVSHGRKAATCFCGLALMAVLGNPVPARAQDYPSIEPAHDAAVTYALNTSSTGPMQIEAFASPSLQMLRLQLVSGSDYLLLDRATERVMLVSPDKGLVFVVPSNGMLHRRLGPDSGLSFARAGHQTIAGVGCTLWTVRGPHGSGDACVTHDGIILAGEGQGDRPDDHGQIPSGRLVATSVSYAALPAALFAPPPGLQEVDLPPSLFRAMIPGLAGIQTP
jgi:hypothetical protein